MEYNSIFQEPPFHNSTFHEILNFLHFCFRKNEKKSSLVANVVGLLIRDPMDAHVIFHGLSSRQSEDEHEGFFLEYMLTHVKAVRHDLGGFLDESCLTSGCPEMLLQFIFTGESVKLLFFLQYGFPAKYVLVDKSKVNPIYRFMYGYQVLTVTYRVMRKIAEYERYDRFRIKDIVEAYHIYMAAVPDPFITLKELRDYQYTSRNLRNISDNNMWQIPCVMYGRYFPQMAKGPKTPRSLMHLSRCVIRRYLSLQLNPLLIKRMKYPTSLKKYLNLNFLY